MIYDLGGRLQTLDFSDAIATDALIADLKHEFGPGGAPRCVLCLLHRHAGHEDMFAFPKMRAFDAGLVDALYRDHLAFTFDLAEIERAADALRALPTPDARIAGGRALTLRVNRFFARYLAHLNREEAELVPLMQQHLTDAEQLSMRAAAEQSMAPEVLAEFQRWIFRSLDVHELEATFRAIVDQAPPEVAHRLLALGAASVPAERWAQVEAALGRADRP
jgi:hypothetical protein